MAVGESVLTRDFVIDNNQPPILFVDFDVFVVDPDVRRSIPVPFVVLDEEGDDVDVVFQWRRAGQNFKDLPTTAAEVQAILGDPTLRETYQMQPATP